MRTLISGGDIIGWSGSGHELIRGGDVVVEADRILYIGHRFKDGTDRRIDATGKLVSPGFINTHVHATTNAGELLLNDPGKRDYFATNYLSYSAPRQGRRIQSFDDEEAETAALFGMVHALKGGATTIVEMGGSIWGRDTFVRKIGDLGIRCYASPGFRSAERVTDPEGRLVYDWNEPAGMEGLKRAVRFIEKHHGSYNGRIQGMLYPRQVDTCTPELLVETKRAARESRVGIQTHAAASLLEFHEILRRHRRTPIEHLHSLGFLGPEVTLAHTIFVTEHGWTKYPYGDDLKIIADSGSSVCYCPLKFAELGVALESLPRYLRAGINLTLGTDSFPMDMLSEMRYAALIARLVEANYLVGTPREVFEMATSGGAKSLGRDDLGRITPGAKADLLLINLRDLRTGAVFDPVKTAVMAATSHDIDFIMVDGRILVQGGKIIDIDEEALLSSVQALSERFWTGVPRWDWGGRLAAELSPFTFPVRSEPDA